MEPVPVAWVSLMRPPAPVSAPAAVQAIRCKAAAVQAIRCKAAAVQAIQCKAAAVQAIQRKDHLQHLWQVKQAKCKRLPANRVAC